MRRAFLLDLIAQRQKLKIAFELAVFLQKPLDRPSQLIGVGAGSSSLFRVVFELNAEVIGIPFVSRSSIAQFKRDHDRGGKR